MSRVALLSSEPIRERMAGIGIRYLELARRLPRPGLEVVLVTPGDPGAVPASGDVAGLEVRRFARGALRSLLGDCDAAVAQGQLANDLVTELPELPVAIDLYDPFLIENLAYLGTLGLDPYRNDHASWVLQLSRGDFFLCSCEEQRLYYLGFLTALGRVNPERLRDDPDLAGLVSVVPFGVPQTLAAHRPWLPPRRPGERRLLFGGLYDWYDPWPVLEALAAGGRDAWTLLFIRNPNPGSTPQQLLAAVQAWCEERGLWGERVQVLDWVPAERRYDLLRDVDLLVATHRPTLETRLSLRTRFLDALAVGLPVVASEGGAIARLLSEAGAGWVVPAGARDAAAAAVEEILGGGEGVAARIAAGRGLAGRFTWQRAIEPLLDFCRSPAVDPTKESYAFRPPTLAPPDRLPFRLRRWLRRLAGP